MKTRHKRIQRTRNCLRRCVRKNTTLATQATIALINSQGDIGAALKDLGSKENIKNLGVAMLSAGIVQGLGSSISFNTADGVKTLNQITAMGGKADLWSQCDECGGITSSNAEARRVEVSIQ